MSTRDLHIGSILKNAHTEGHLRSLPTRRLNQWGELEGQACIANTPERIAKVKACLVLHQSIQLRATKRKDTRAAAALAKQQAEDEKQARIAEQMPLRAAMVECAMLASVETAPLLKQLREYAKAKDIKLCNDNSTAISKANKAQVLEALYSSLASQD